MRDKRLSILHVLSHEILARRGRSCDYLYSTDGKRTHGAVHRQQIWDLNTGLIPKCMLIYWATWPNVSFSKSWLPVDLSHVHVESNNRKKRRKTSSLPILVLVLLLRERRKASLAHHIFWNKNRSLDNLLTGMLWAPNIMCKAPPRMTNTP